MLYLMYAICVILHINYTILWVLHILKKYLVHFPAQFHPAVAWAPVEFTNMSRNSARFRWRQTTASRRIYQYDKQGFS